MASWTEHDWVERNWKKVPLERVLNMAAAHCGDVLERNVSIIDGSPDKILETWTRVAA